MEADSRTPPKYQLAKVEGALLYEIISQHPAHMTVEQLTQLIVADLGDSREVRTATTALHELRQMGLVHNRDDEIVEPTQAALHAHTLLVG